MAVNGPVLAAKCRARRLVQTNAGVTWANPARNCAVDLDLSSRRGDGRWHRGVSRGRSQRIRAQARIAYPDGHTGSARRIRRSLDWDAIRNVAASRSLGAWNLASPPRRNRVSPAFGSAQRLLPLVDLRGTSQSAAPRGQIRASRLTVDSGQ